MFYLYAYCETGDKIYDEPIWYGIKLHMIVNGTEYRGIRGGNGKIDTWGNGEGYWKNVMEVKTI